MTASTLINTKCQCVSHSTFSSTAYGLLLEIIPVIILHTPINYKLFMQFLLYYQSKFQDFFINWQC